MSVAFFLIFCVNTIATQALWCYQCNSSHHANCLESLKGDASLAPEPCDTYAARYCVKTTGIYGARTTWVTNASISRFRTTTVSTVRVYSPAKQKRATQPISFSHIRYSSSSLQCQ
ncbi:hypothetical protein CRM22_004134 [Opisthorchis felineus]|uniref:Protein quiver n=1 Tax=Opisthorchis felineus TaxID=147828 RepID=A0A4S2LYI0_OPIFE|nr:hypothetical protein CRM22_004134 [Opisthorchis felineus]